jgi:hypothetical protein
MNIVPFLIDACFLPGRRLPPETDLLYSSGAGLAIENSRENKGAVFRLGGEALSQGEQLEIRFDMLGFAF